MIQAIPNAPASGAIFSLRGMGRLMLGKLSVALLLATAPAVAAEPASDIKVDESGQAYRIKKVCRTVEVAGSFIPRTSCINKKVPVKKSESGAQEAAKTDGATADASIKEQNEQ